MKLRQVAFRNITRNKRRSMLSMTAIGVATMAIVMLFSLIEGIKVDMAHNLQTFYYGEYRIRHEDFGKYEQLNPLHLRIQDYQNLADKLQKNPDVLAVSPRLTLPAAIYQEGTTYRAEGMGLDFEREAKFQNLQEQIVKGEMPRQGKNEVLVGYALAEEMGLSVGDKFTFMTQTMRRGSNAITMKITGLVNFPLGALNKLRFIMPLDRAQYTVRMDNSVQEVLIKLTDQADRKAFETWLEDTYSSNPWEIRYWKNIGASYGLIEMAAEIYNYIALFFFLLGSAVIINTTMMVIYERMKEIGTLGALGMSGSSLVKMFFIEAFYLGLGGAFFGMLAGVLLTIPLSHFGISFGQAMEGVSFEMSDSLYPILNLRSTFFVFFYSVLVASLASLVPSRRAARIEPVEALRSI